MSGAPGLKAFINLRLGEPWEEDGDALEAHALRSRCEKYPEDADVPNGVGLLTASVDVQSSGRLECVEKKPHPGTSGESLARTWGNAGGWINGWRSDVD